MKSKRSLLSFVAPTLVLLVAAVVLAGCASNSLPLPTITSLNPSTVTAGGPGFTLKVIGTGFLSTDVVEWNGQVLPTQPVSSTELDAQVPGTLIQSAIKAKAAFRLASLRQPRALLTPDQTTGDVTVDVTVLQKPPGSVVSNTITFTITPSNPTPALTITKSHSGNFTQGQTGATFTITVSNAGNGPTDGSTVTAAEVPPSGLTVTNLSGNGWTCVLTSLSCTRSDALAADSSYPTITVTASVATNAPATITNSVSISGGGSTGGTGSDMVTITPPPTPALKITKTHTGNFTQGQTGATFTITASNTGTGPTSGTVTVMDTPPTGLTITALSGTGWTCTITNVTCTRSDALAAGSSYSTITVTVSVATNAPSSVTNTVSVSGAGSTPATGNDTVTITPPPTPALKITKTHTGNFTQGQTGATFTVTASNTGTGPTSGTVTVMDTPPTGLTITALSGTGWTCTITNVTCTRSDALAAGSSYPAITVTVSVATNAPPSVTNTVSVSGGGSTPATGNDTVTVVPPPPPALKITKTHTGNFTQGQTGATFTVTASNTGTGPTSGTVTVMDTPPAGLTITALSGTGWTCTITNVTCTRSDALAAGGTYPAITVTVSVATNASSSVTNTVAISGGGSTGATGSDTVTVVAPPTPALKITKTHTGNFTQGQTGATFTVTASNTGTGPTSGTVTVMDTPPTGLTITALSGTGWTCTITNVTCTRGDALAAGGTYPTITVTVSVATNAPASVTNTVSVSGGGSTPATGNDTVTVVTPPTPALKITKTHTGNFTQGQTGATFTVNVSNTGTGPTSGTVTVMDTPPTGLTITALSGTGWTCTISNVTCTRSDALAAGGTYPAITVTVSVATNAPSSVTNMVSISGGGSAGGTAADTVTINSGTPAPALAITKTHVGTFNQGGTGAYTITVSNAGTAPLTSTVTVSDTIPSGLTPLTLTGTGWTCSIGVTVGCSRSDSLAGGSSYPAITLTVSVSTAAPATVTNKVIVTSGSLTASASDPTVINPAASGPAFTVTGTGPTSATLNNDLTVYFTVKNTGTSPTSGTVTVQIGSPSSIFLPIAIFGDPWNCQSGTLTCTRSDVLSPGQSYPPIGFIFQIPTGAPSPFTVFATVSGGGAASNATLNLATPVVNCSPASGILCGQFAIFTQGYTSAGPRAIAASFTADGAGNITAGTVDVNSMGAPQTGLAVLMGAPTGFNFESNGFGNIILNTSAGAFTFKFIQNTAGNYANVIEFESSGSAGGSGFMIQQNPSYLATGVTGSYALAAIGGLGGSSAGVRLGMVGAANGNGACGFAASGSTGTINSGGSVSTAVNFSGTQNPASCTLDPTTGRGTLSLTSITGSPAPPFSTANFVYYVYGMDVTGNVTALWLLSTDQTGTAHPLLSGGVQLQSNAPYNTNAALDCGVLFNPTSSTGCVFATSGATGGNSISGSGHVAAGVATVTTQSNTAGSMSLLLDDNKGGVVNSGTISATYSYAADGTGVITPASGEGVAFVLTDIDSGITLGTGGSVAFGRFARQTAPTFSASTATNFIAGTAFEGTEATTNTLVNSTFTPSSIPSNSGAISGNTRSWNSASLQTTNTLSGTYTTAPLTGRGTGTTSSTNGIDGAGSFTYYVINANSLVLIGTAASGTGSTTPVLLSFQAP